MSETHETARICLEVRELLADHHADPTGMQRRVAQAHLKSCRDCSAEINRQSAVSEGLSALKDEGLNPPDGLLDDVLASAEQVKGVRTRLAAPARGAISGARPQLTAAVIVTGALAGTGVGWATVRGVRRLRTKRRRPIS